MAPDVLVVGAGLAGSTAARALADAGCRVLALDKGRGPGGRLSTRRTRTGTFDHGAAALQASTPSFAAWLDAEAKAGRAVGWADGHVGLPGMSALVAGLLNGLEVQWSVGVAALRRDAARWSAIDADGRIVGEAPILVLAVPAPQAAALLKNSPLPGDLLPVGLIPALEAVRYAPCWAALLTVDVDAVRGVPQPAADGLVEAIVREADKPGRENAGHWVVHATAGWSEANLEADAGEIALRLREAFIAQTGVAAAAVREVSAHRWRYARALGVLDPARLEREDLVLAGDAFGLPSSAGLPPAERAWMSGRAAADRVFRARQPKS